MENKTQTLLQQEPVTSRPIEFVNGQVQPADAAGRLEKDAYLQKFIGDEQLQAVIEGREPALHRGAQSSASWLTNELRPARLAEKVDRVGIDQAIADAEASDYRGAGRDESLLRRAKVGMPIDRTEAETKFLAGKLAEKKDARELEAYGGKLPLRRVVAKKVGKLLSRGPTTL